MIRLRWLPGRQGSGYRKLPLVEGRVLGDLVGFDAYVIDYPPGSHVPPHVDPVPGKRHFRANLRLLGEDRFRGRALLRLGPLVVFRPDVTLHAVRPVTRRRVVLSVGLAL